MSFLHRFAGIAILLSMTGFFSSCGCHCASQKGDIPLPPPSTFEAKELVVRTPGGTYPVSVTAKGRRPVLLLHELNGQSPGCLSLGKELADAGCKVYIPRFYGAYGCDIPLGWKWLKVARSPEWKLFSKHGGTIRQDIQAIAEQVKKLNPGQPVTVIGNCMTGGQALALLADPQIDTAVVCQPAAPMCPFTKARCRAFGVPSEAVDKAIQAMRNDSGKRLVSFNYLDDPVAPYQRTKSLADRTLAAGVEKQHHLWIGVTSDHSLADCRPVSKHPGLRALAVNGSTIPHPTVTSASGMDLDIYRDKLFEELGLPQRQKSIASTGVTCPKKNDCSVSFPSDKRGKAD